MVTLRDSKVFSPKVYSKEVQDFLIWALKILLDRGPKNEENGICWSVRQMYHTYKVDHHVDFSTKHADDLLSVCIEYITGDVNIHQSGFVVMDNQSELSAQGQYCLLDLWKGRQLYFRKALMARTINLLEEGIFNVT